MKSEDQIQLQFELYLKALDDNNPKNDVVKGWVNALKWVLEK